MAPRQTRSDQEHQGEAVLGLGQASHPRADPDMLFPDASKLDTDVEDADLFLGWDDDDDEPEPPHLGSS